MTSLSFMQSSQNAKMPWIEKYRPASLDQIMSHQDIILTLDKFIEMKTIPHLLFFGPSGTGKTSTIKCCARKIYGDYMNYMVLELNASNDRGIDTVRTKIKNFVSNKTRIFLPDHMRNLFKLVILDESDSMTIEAQGMLRQIIEKNSATTRFCLICNDIDKLNIALQSRCALFCFLPLPLKDMLKKLDEICTFEKIKHEPNALQTIIKISKGDMRSAINTLQHINLTVDNEITVENIYRISGFCVPAVIENIFALLCDLHQSRLALEACVNETIEIVLENSITIFNLLSELAPKVMDSELSIDQKIFLVDNFALIETYDAVNIDPRVILMIISSLFIILRRVN